MHVKKHMSNTSHWLKYLLYLLWISLVNPFVVVINLIVVWINLPKLVGINSNKLPAAFIPIWLLNGLITAAIVSGLWFLLVRGRQNPLPFARFWGIDAYAHIPYSPFILSTFFFLFSEVDGAMMGFVIIPAFVILTLITAPISWVLLFALRRRAQRY